MLIDKLKKEIDLKYNIIQYKNLMKRYILNRIEKNNINILFSTIEDINIERNKN